MDPCGKFFGETVSVAFNKIKIYVSATDKSTMPFIVVSYF
jgi:hypothetical protein